MRHMIFGLLVLVSLLLLIGCGDDAARPPDSRGDNTVAGEIADSDFEFEIPGDPGDPSAGPFLLRGTNLHYDDADGVLVVDLSVSNLGFYPHREPIGLTFIKLDPDEVGVANPDNGIHGDGAGIVFSFANDDGVWTPGETSLPRTVEFSVARGVSIAFVARLELGPPIGVGAIAGRVWNDGNRNGMMEDDEAGLAGIDVYLLSFTGDDDSTSTREFGYAVTDGDGHYAFKPLRAGGYVVSIAPSTIALTPTTPTEIHVLLVEVDGEVSSYRNANFGAVPHDVTPPLPGKRVHVTGKFYEPDQFAAHTVEPVPCDSVPAPGTPPDPDCEGGILRGPVTGLDQARNVPRIRIMNTWILAYADRFPRLPQIGERVEARVFRNEWWVLASINEWPESHDELVGFVEQVETEPDGTLRIRVLDTWIALANVVIGEK